MDVSTPAEEMAGASVPPPPVVASKPFLSPSAMWERFARALPATLKDKPEDEQIAYFRRLYASYQQQFSRERAKRDRAVFACIDQYRSYILSHYKPLYPELRGLQDHFLHPEFLAVLRKPSPEAWRAFAAEVHPGVLRFPILQPDWCAKLLHEVDNFEAWSQGANLHVNRPNSMNNYGCVLDDMGFNDVLQRLTTGPIREMATALFGAGSGAEALDSHHGFIVEYAPRKDRALGFHVDDSEITLNLCLGTAFEGGDLFFRGPRCPSHQQGASAPEEYFQYRHEAGIAVMHIGRHRHGALPLTAGRRANLILWCRSSAFRATTNLTECQPFCARHPSHVHCAAAAAAADAAESSSSAAPRAITAVAAAAPPSLPSSSSSSAAAAAVAAAAADSEGSDDADCAAHAPAPGAGPGPPDSLDDEAEAADDDGDGPIRHAVDSIRYSGDSHGSTTSVSSAASARSEGFGSSAPSPALNPAAAPSA